MAAGQTRQEALLFAAVVSTLITVVLSVAGDTLIPGERLEDVRNSSLVSADRKFRLGFFSPLTSTRRYVGIWYDQIPAQTVVWVANRDKPLRDNTGVLSISGNGSLSISDAKDVVYWSTPSTMLAKPSAKLLIGGNFVVSAAGKYAWESFDHPTHAILPGIKLGFDRRSGLNRNLTSWKSDQEPAVGSYTLFMNSRGVPEILLLKDMKPILRSGPWVGEVFSGVQGIKNYPIIMPSYVSNANEVYYQFSVPNATVLTMVVVAVGGELKRLLWREDDGKWDEYWAGPVDRCDYYGSCGVFGVCMIDGSPKCSCLPGFEPISPTNWNSGIWTEGCKRRTAVDCRNGTDGYSRVVRAKLPDTSQAVVNNTMGMDECREVCLMNCSCTAYASAKTNGGSDSGCIMWGGDLMDLRVYNEAGQDLFVRLASADLDWSRKRRRAMMTTAVVVAAVVVILFLLLIGWFLRRRRKQNHPGALGSNPDGYSDEFRDMGVSREVDVPSFDLAAIVAATDNFSADRTLGIGGFGPVYKGLLEGKREVAVKRLAKSSSQGGDEFMNEVRVIAKLQHRNLVRLLGFCVDREERILVYEYMPNGSLDSILFDKTKAPLLDWPMRLRIIGGVARGLLYLHQDSRLRIIHRDLKAGNVLLDEGMNPKISDFGMARIFSGDERQGITRRVVGTYGYMSPEYAMDGTFSVKSDVYSFGVLVLEVISGRRNGAIFDSDRKLNLLVDAWNLWKEGEGLELVDSSPGGLIQIAEVLKCIKIGLLCVQERPDDRPDMAAVVIMLVGDNAALPPPKPPGFAVARERSEGCGNSTVTLNNVTLSALHGR